MHTYTWNTSFSSLGRNQTTVKEELRYQAKFCKILLPLSKICLNMNNFPSCKSKLMVQKSEPFLYPICSKLKGNISKPYQPTLTDCRLLRPKCSVQSALSCLPIHTGMCSIWLPVRLPYYKLYKLTLTDCRLLRPRCSVRSALSRLPIHTGMCSIWLPVRLSTCRQVRFSRPSILVMLLYDRFSSLSLISLSSRSIRSTMFVLRFSTCSLFRRSRFSMYWNQARNYRLYYSPVYSMILIYEPRQAKFRALRVAVT